MFEYPKSKYTSTEDAYIKNLEQLNESLSGISCVIDFINAAQLITAIGSISDSLDRIATALESKQPDH